MATEFNIQGLDELNRALQELPAKIEQDILRDALRSGLQQIADAAKANVSVKSGALRDSIRIKTSSRGGKVTTTVVAGDKKAFYAHMVEFGTAAHFIKPKNKKSLFFAGLAREGVNHPGSKPKPFMRPAMDANTAGALDAVREYIATRLPKELDKAAS